MKMKSTAILKLHVNGSTSANKEHPAPLVEFYKQIPEDQGFVPTEKHIQNPLESSNKSELEVTGSIPEQTQLDSAAVTNKENGKMVAEQNGLNDGADEQMLSSVEDNDKLADKREEVKFIKGGDHQNGDAKIDIGVVNGKDKELAFTGMTKEELMKYANDPFWVRLRWIFFIGFWAIWAAMLICAILIIVDAPKCAAPEPLPWYKRGLLAKFDGLESRNSDIASAKVVGASAVIYELPPALTYLVDKPEVENVLKQIIENYKNSDINVILDITPNYVPSNSTLFSEAKSDKSKRSAFIWKEGSQNISNWRSLQNASAWAEVEGNFVLSQFGAGLYDLKMNDIIVKREFEGVLKHLLDLGIKGFRLKNTKFFLISDNTPDEVLSSKGNFGITDYGFWTHTHSTFQEGLGDLLYEYKMFVKNISADAFLSVADDILRPEVYKTKSGQWGVDVPIYGPFVNNLRAGSNVTKLKSEFKNIVTAVGNDTWLQWNFAEQLPVDNLQSNPSAIALFVSLLPGVPVVATSNASFFNALKPEFYNDIKKLRLSPSYMHGKYNVFPLEGLFAYSRIKSGNPGYLVAFNPSNTTVKGEFVDPSLPDKMSVYALSDNYNISGITVKSKVETNSVEVSPEATIILTFVPVKSG